MCSSYYSVHVCSGNHSDSNQAMLSEEQALWYLNVDQLNQEMRNEVSHYCI